MRLRPAYNYERVVIGATLDAAICAYENRLPLIFLKRKPPHVFDCTAAGHSKQLLFKKLIFLLSLNGLVPVPTGAAYIKIDENNMIVSTANAGQVSINFEKAIVFDEMGLHGLQAPTLTRSSYLVMDWFNVRAGTCHEHKILESDSHFVNKVQFYPSERIDGRHDKKDLVAFSYLGEEQIDELEYSETFVRLKVIDMMKAAGIHGTKNGIDPETGAQKYRSLKIESAHREKINLSRPDYSDTKSIIFDKRQNTDEDIELKLGFLI